MREEIRQHYRENQEEIKQRIESFRDLRDADDARIFKELVFVILTSQSPAKSCWKAAQELDRLGLLEEPDLSEISRILREHSIQYEENKASYIAENRKKLSHPTLEDPSGSLKLGEKIDPENLEGSRKWLVENLKGIGWKGASHFLRNTGYGNSFAIISSHIVKKLSSEGLLEDRPATREEYLEAEQKIQAFAEEENIPVQELDLVLWSMETGEIFK